MTDVHALARWDGWCSPCGTSRPLVLTELGPRGLLAWLRGNHHEDRELNLFCRVCGVHQHVPQDEADDPPVLVSLDDVLDVDPVGLVPVGTSWLLLARGPAPRPAAVPAAVAAPAAPAAPRAAAVPAPRGSVTTAPATGRASATAVSLPLPVARAAVEDSETALDLVAAGLATA
jgi:hypothetical protein